MNEFDRILIEQGISLIPRVDGTKQPPAGFTYSDRWNGEKIADLQETSSWQVHDRAAICGVNHLVVFDFDSLESYERFWDKRLADNLPNETLSVRTSRGIQNWFFDHSLSLENYVSVIDGAPAVRLEIFLQKHLAAVPNNTHPSGKKYALLGTFTVARRDRIVEKAVERLKSMHWLGRIYSDAPGIVQLGPLTQQITDLNEVANGLAPYWKPGYRNKLVLALTGYLIRRGICEDSALKLIDAIIIKTGDLSARASALAKVRYSYKNREKIRLFQGLPSLNNVKMEIDQSCQT